MLGCLFPPGGLRCSRTRSPAPARCRGSPGSCHPTSVTAQTTSAQPRPRRTRAPRRLPRPSSLPPLPAAVLFGVVLQAPFAFEAAVFEDLLFRRHTFEREAHLDGLHEDRRISDGRFVQNRVAIE